MGMLAIGAATALLLLGCGESGDAPALTKSQLVKQGNVICKKGLEEKDKALKVGFDEIKAAPGPPTRQEVEKLVTDMLPSFDSTIQELGELGPPSEDKDVVEGFLAEYEDALRQAEEQPAKVVRTSPFTPANEAAQKYGLENCNL
jgi:hypothetical protein